MSQMSSRTFSSIDGLHLEAKVVDPAGSCSGHVLLVHGITATLDEGGMYERLAEDLARAGLQTTRFSFRGHGGSDGLPESVSIAGELLDLYSVVREIGPVDGIVASSFGAVSTILLLESMPAAAQKLVLWNPVLSLADTFLEPSLPWGRKNFGRRRIQDALLDGGVVQVDEEFTLAATVFVEMEHYDIETCFAGVGLETLVVHGTADEYVSYDVAARACTGKENATLLSVDGADHGFDRPDEEAIARRATVDFLAPGWSQA